jgi:hypothetical protein
MTTLNIMLHFGFPKTASSSLQFGLFLPLHKENQINLKTWRRDNNAEHLDQRPSSRLFKREPILEHYLNYKNNMLNILSDESFTAPIRLRRNNFGNELEDPINFPKKIKTQITNTCGNAINFIPVVFIRQQSHLLYSQYVEEYNLKQYRGVDLLFDGNGNIDLEGYEIYRFADYIEELENVFGKGKINIFLYEKWQQNYNEFINFFSKHTDLETTLINSLLKNSSYNSKKKNSRGYFTKNEENFIPLFSNKINEEIMQHFYTSNSKLRNYIPEADLANFGYI